MNKTTARWLCALGGVVVVAICIVFGQQTQGTELNSDIRRNPTDIILPDWRGKWDCNLDGRQTTVEFRLVEDTFCQGNICQNIFKITGRMIDTGGTETPLEPRDYGEGDPPTARLDHLLPLRFKSNEGWLPMLLMMHTGNREYASGYVRWNAIPFGIQCRKSGSLPTRKKLAQSAQTN
jgi:hypothetical protein